ncbi:MAG: hypothetical protein AABY46_04000 [Nitrospirota bacterium]
MGSNMEVGRLDSYQLRWLGGAAGFGSFGDAPPPNDPSLDYAQIRNNAARLADASVIPTVRCGRKKGGKNREALCAQRAVLLALGWISQKAYESVDAKAETLPAIRRLQKAVGAQVDGDWGPETTSKLQAVIDKALGKGKATMALTLKSSGSAAVSASGTGKPKASSGTATGGNGSKGSSSSSSDEPAVGSSGLSFPMKVGLGVLGVALLSAGVWYSMRSNPSLAELMETDPEAAKRSLAKKLGCSPEDIELQDVA